MESFRAHGADGAKSAHGADQQSTPGSTACGNACSDSPASSSAACGSAGAGVRLRGPRQARWAPRRAGAPPGDPPWWTLVWCHERCCKQESAWKQAAIGDTAHDLGATLVYIRKAKQFATWTAQAGPSPRGLLTDWVEVKTCLEAAEACPPSARPAFVVIYCELPKSRARAAAWAAARSPLATPVRVLADLSLLELCLRGLVLQAQCAIQLAPMQPVAAVCVYVVAECADAPAVQGRGSLEKSILERQTEYLPMEANAGASDGQQQLEEMLVSAMPDHYDD